MPPTGYGLSRFPTVWVEKGVKRTLLRAETGSPPTVVKVAPSSVAPGCGGDTEMISLPATGLIGWPAHVAPGSGADAGVSSALGCMGASVGVTG